VEVRTGLPLVPEVRVRSEGARVRELRQAVDPLAAQRVPPEGRPEEAGAVLTARGSVDPGRCVVCGARAGPPGSMKLLCADHWDPAMTRADVERALPPGVEEDDPLVRMVADYDVTVVYEGRMRVTVGSQSEAEEAAREARASDFCLDLIDVHVGDGANPRPEKPSREVRRDIAHEVYMSMRPPKRRPPGQRALPGAGA